MEDALTKALEFANFPATLNTQKTILKNKYNDNCALYFKGGKFTVSMTLFFLFPIYFPQCRVLL